jgi:DNA-binding CsgD family transcriptional regulator
LAILRTFENTIIHPTRMNRTYIFYGIGLGLLFVVLRMVEYQFLIRTHIFEIYGGLIALLFTGLGIWTGFRLTQKKSTFAPEKKAIELDENKIKAFNISKREYEVLELMTEGLSNQEIADRLFVSLNTIKTHSARLFEKLEVNSRVKAINKAKELGIIRVN